MAPGGEHVYATLLLSDSYLPGALVLAHSLRDAQTTKSLAVLVTLDTVSADAVTRLKSVYDHVIPVPRIRNAYPANLHLMNRSDLHSAFTKINLWKQLQFSRVVYVDADVVAYRAPDELFSIPHPFAAAPDIGWPDLFNTGVMVLTPNMGDYYAMTAMAERGISFDGADQGLMNMHFGNSYHRISFAYNVTPSAHYQYIPAYRHFQSGISMVHFIGPDKPWFAGRNTPHGNSPFNDMVGRWWAVYDKHYREQETLATEGLSSGPSTAATQKAVVPTAVAAGLSLAHQSASTGLDHIPPDTTAKDPPANQPSTPAPTMIASWDAQRHAPPVDSGPEAIGLPTAHYTMSRDATPFVPPQSYPSPPKGMWYQVPKEPPSPEQQPKPVFPWESRQPIPSRIFAGEAQPTPAAQHSADTQASSAPRVDDGPPTPSTPSTRATEHQRSSSGHWNLTQLDNAWDDVPGISRYVVSLQKHRRVKSLDPQPGEVASPLAETPPSGPSAPSAGLKLTDFPTEVERPSLPVTPAPVGRSSFWGKDDTKVGEAGSKEILPAAEGVPLQSEWDPEAQLEKLAKQQSELLRRLSGSEQGEGGMGPGRTIPKRAMPFGSEDAKSPTHVAQGPHAGIPPLQLAGSAKSTEAEAEPAGKPESAVVGSSPAETTEIRESRRAADASESPGGGDAEGDGEA